MNAPFVTFEGIEGSGKSTQIRLLSDYLGDKGIRHLVTREPGGTALADEIRSLLLSRREEFVFPETELLLYAAARAQHVRTVILPSLSSGKAVLCDRFLDATVAYQEHGRGLQGESVDRLNVFATGGLSPDLTFCLDVDPEQGFARVRERGARPDRIESERMEFHRKVRDGYLRQHASHPDRIVLIDGSLPVADVFRRVVDAVSARLGW